MYSLHFANAAQSVYKKLDKTALKFVDAALADIAQHGCNPKGAKTIIAMTGKEYRGVWRCTRGDYRVIFKCNGLAVSILAIGHRREIYKRI